MTRQLTVLPLLAVRPPAGASAVAATCASADGTCTELSPRHADLEAAGWVRRFAAGPPRLEEMTSAYHDMGFAVLHEPLDDTLLGEACSGCAPARIGFRAIYTRKEP